MKMSGRRLLDAAAAAVVVVGGAVVGWYTGELVLLELPQPKPQQPRWKVGVPYTKPYLVRRNVEPGFPTRLQSLAVNETAVITYEVRGCFGGQIYKYAINGSSPRQWCAWRGFWPLLQQIGDDDWKELGKIELDTHELKKVDRLLDRYRENQNRGGMCTTVEYIKVEWYRDDDIVGEELIVIDDGVGIVGDDVFPLCRLESRIKPDG